MAVAGQSCFIDLSLDDDEEFHLTTPGKAPIPLIYIDSDDEESAHSDLDEVEIFDAITHAENPKNRGKGKAKEERVKNATPGPSTLTVDEELALELSRAEDAPVYSAEDEELARKLAEEEEAQFQALVEEIDKKEEGIVFTLAVNAEDNTLEDGSPAHQDDLDRFQPWKVLFEQCGHKVKKFHWFVNYELEKRFDAARDRLWDVMGERPKELMLFHGTATQNIDSILKGGFRIGGVGGHPISHGTASGYGIYLAEQSATSVGYATDVTSTCRIFACRVLPGRVTHIPMHYPPPSIEVGNETHESYSAPGVYVVRYASLVLPCYMIEYDNPYAPGLLGGLGGIGWPLFAAVPPVAALPPVAIPVAPVAPAKRTRKKKAEAVRRSPRKRKQ